MSGLSTTLIFSCPPESAREILEVLQRDAMPDLGNETAQVALFSSARNSFIESCLPPLIREAGVAGLGFLEAIANHREDKGELAADGWSLLSGESLAAATSGLHDVVAIRTSRRSTPGRRPFRQRERAFLRDKSREARGFSSILGTSAVDVRRPTRRRRRGMLQRNTP